MPSKKTLVIGASLNSERYSNKAVRNLRARGHSVEAIGLREGFIGDVKIEKKLNFFPAIHTVSLYIGPQHQIKYYGYIIGLKPQRVVFNPGTENQIFYDLLSNAGVFFEESCTLVLLSTNQY